MSFLLRVARDDSGATAIEYALIASLIAVFIVGALTTVGSQLSGAFVRISSSF